MRLRRGHVRGRGVGAAVVVAALLLAGCGTGGGGGGGGGAVAREPLALLPRAERKPLPELTGAGLDGRRVALSRFAGQVVLVNGWQSTCGPCRAEMPGLVRVQQRYGGRGLRVVGYNAEANESAARAFVARYGVTYPVMYDPSGRELLRVPKGVVNPQFVPFTFLVDKRGRVAAAMSGPVSERRAAAAVGKLLAEK
ncbi:TlpA family protein disulfide reductase [Streptomyces sp. SPB074]|uniref:TlpA family protein disulfide reductase n=1 Tax=Streptomyces sp. (strain SPB074) TaxID=465543 RepID=UPI00017FEF75|nr:TlpA disulfide reductase family protein [Streptomyces sp. SPB074]EDY46399.1 thioredoxin family thiol:disulfide interchange protein [Streptomyces sp. SPB074]